MCINFPVLPNASLIKLTLEMHMVIFAEIYYKNLLLRKIFLSFFHIDLGPLFMSLILTVSVTPPPPHFTPLPTQPVFVSVELPHKYEIFPTETNIRCKPKLCHSPSLYEATTHVQNNV